MIAVQDLDHIVHFHKLDVTLELDRFAEKRWQVTEIFRERLSDTLGVNPPPRLPVDVRYNHTFMSNEVHEKELG